MTDITRTKKYTALELVTMAFPDGIDVETGATVDHVVNEQDLEANPGLAEVTKVGETIQYPEMANISTEEAFGRYAITIGGIAGIVDPDKKIIVDGGLPVVIQVGNVSAELAVAEPAEA